MMLKETTSSLNRLAAVRHEEKPLSGLNSPLTTEENPLSTSKMLCGLISVADILFNTLDTLGLINRLSLKYKLLILVFFASAGIKEIIGQTTSNQIETINAQYIHAVLADDYNANGAATNEAMLNNLVLAIQDGFDNNDIRLYNDQFVWTIDRTDAPELTTNHDEYDDLGDFAPWFVANGDPKDFQVCFFETMAYEAQSANGPSSPDGWCRTVVGGGSDWVYTFSHELLHTMGVLNGGHDQALTNATHEFNPGSGWITNYDGKDMAAINAGGGFYLDGIYGTPAEYNKNSTIYGGDGYRHFEYSSAQPFPCRIAVDDMDINNSFTNVTQGAVDFYSDGNYDWKIRHIPIADYGFTVEDVAPTPQVNVSGNSASFANGSACNVHFPVTTDPNFQDDYFIEGTYEGYLYLASNPADGAQIAGPIALDESFTNLTDGDYVVRYYERRSNTLGAPSEAFSIDGVPPTGDITSDVETITNLPSFEITLDFSEPINPATFSLSDFSKTNCNLSGLTFNGDNTAVTVSVAPVTGGTVSLWMNANKFQDLGGNWNLSIATWSVIYDGTGSTVEFTTPEYPTTNENPVSFTMTITEPNGINGLTQSDINAVGGTINNWNYSGGNTATFDLITDGNNGSYTVSTTEGAFDDDAGNPSQAGNIEGELDYEAPYSADGFQCAVGELTNLSSFPMSIQFNETLADFTSSKLNLNNCTVTNFQNNGNGNYSWEVVSGNDGFMAISMDAGVCHDFLPGGNGNIVFPAWSTTFDGTATTGEMASTVTSPTNIDDIPVEGSVSEVAYGLDASDFEVDNGSLENITFDGQTFSFDIIPAGYGLITVTVPAGSFTDEAGNPNEEFWFTIFSDQIAPELDITYDETSPTNADPIHVNINASENINLDASDITVENGVLVNFAGSGDSYTGEIEPNEDGEVTASINGDDYSDTAGNLGISSTGTIESDQTAPQLNTTGPASIYSGNDAEIIYTADEPIVGFDNSDIEVDNGESTNFAGFENLYTSTIVDAVSGQIHVNVTGDYYDIAGNAGLTVEEFTIDVITGTPEISAIEGVKVYPNPTKNILNIEAGESILKVLVYDAMGNCLENRIAASRQVKQPLNGSSVSIDVSKLANGIYFLRIVGVRGNSISTRIVKE